MAKPDPAWFGPRLRELRIAAGLTQKQLGARVGKEVGAVARWELGKRQPTWVCVLALCAALDVEPNAFAQKPTVLPPGPPKIGRPRKKG